MTALLVFVAVFLVLGFGVAFLAKLPEEIGGEND